MNVSDTELSTAEQQMITGSLREGEELLWAAPSLNSTPQTASLPFWKRLFSKKRAPLPRAAHPQERCVYAITSKRVLVFAPQAPMREWFLMLGMIQQFSLQDNGCGDIVLDYELAPDGTRRLLGLFNIADAQRVHDLLSSAIGAAYSASPWSV